MEATQNGNSQPSRLDRLKVAWQTVDKKTWTKLGGVVVTIGVLVLAGLRTGAPWHRAPKK